MWRLPRKVEQNSNLCEKILERLESNKKPLWKNGTLYCSSSSMNKEMSQAISLAWRARALKSGLEKIAKILQNEALGLREDKNNNTSNRISRILLLSEDGSERFYRQVEKIAKEHTNRVLVLTLEGVTAEDLGGFFGKEEKAKSVLITRSEFVVKFLEAITS